MLQASELKFLCIPVGTTLVSPVDGAMDAPADHAMDHTSLALARILIVDRHVDFAGCTRLDRPLTAAGPKTSPLAAVAGRAQGQASCAPRRQHPDKMRQHPDQKTVPFPTREA